MMQNEVRSYGWHGGHLLRAVVRVGVMPVVVMLLTAFALNVSGCKSSAPAPSSKASPPKESAGKSREATLFQDDPESLKEFQAIQGEIRSSNYAEAVKRFEAMLQRAPKAPWAEYVLYQLAQAYRMMNDARGALKKLELFLELYPDSPDALRARINRGEILYGMGRDSKGEGALNPASLMYLREALRIFEDVQEKNPQDPDLQAEMAYYQGTTNMTLQDLPRAKSALQNVVDEYGNSKFAPQALYALAGVFLSEADVDSAERAYGELTDKYPNSAHAGKAKRKMEGIALVGHKAPNLQVKEWIGQPPGSLEEMKGKTVLLSFWGVWCPHCRRNLPRLDALVRKYAGQGLQVVGITREREGKGMGEIHEYISSHPMLFSTGVDEGGKTSVAYAVSDIPCMAIVDAQGIIRWYGNPEYLTDQVIQKLMSGSN